MLLSRLLQPVFSHIPDWQPRNLEMLTFPAAGVLAVDHDEQLPGTYVLAIDHGTCRLSLEHLAYLADSDSIFKTPLSRRLRWDCL